MCVRWTARRHTLKNSLPNKKKICENIYFIDMLPHIEHIESSKMFVYNWRNVLLSAACRNFAFLSESVMDGFIHSVLLCICRCFQEYCVYCICLKMSREYMNIIYIYELGPFRCYARFFFFFMYRRERHAFVTAHQLTTTQYIKRA